MFNFEKLRVYEDSLVFVDHVYTTTKTWPVDERYGLSDQLRRAANSIVLNIAEGTSRTKKDFCHFLDLSRGSCYECVSILKIAHNRKYVSQQDYHKLYDEIETISRKISALKKSLR
jgi:four helix bundle protein